MKNKITPLALAIALSISTSTYAESLFEDENIQTDESTEVIEAENIRSIDDLYDEWMENYGNYLIENDIAQVYFGSNISTKTTPTMSVFEMAYDRAVVNALESAARQEELSGTSEMISVFVDDDPKFKEDLCTVSGKKEADSGLDKVLKVGKLMLENQLIEQGIDEAEVKEVLETKTHEEIMAKFTDAYKSSSKQSSNFVPNRGFVTADTFTKVNDDGSVEVGVVLVKFLGLEQMLNEMFSNPNNFNPEDWDFSRLNIRSISDEDGNGVIEGMSFESVHEYATYSAKQGSMGTELVLNSNGYPTFISYSYKSQKKSKNKVKDRKYAKSAKMKAGADADAELLKTLDLRTKYTTEILNMESYAINAVAEYADCGLVEGSEYEREEQEFSESIKSTVVVKSVPSKKLKGSKRKSGKYINPENENDKAYYAYTYWSPFDSMSQSTHKTKSVKKTAEDKAAEVENKKVSDRKESDAKSSSKFRMEF